MSYSNVVTLAPYKKEELLLRIIEIKPSTIALTGVLPKNCSEVPTANEYAIPGFNQFMNDKSSRGCALAKNMWNTD